MLDIIKEITDEKIRAGIRPAHVLDIEIMRKYPGLTKGNIDAQARLLVSAGLIRTGPTLNYTYYELIQR